MHKIFMIECYLNKYKWLCVLDEKLVQIKKERFFQL